MKIEYSIFGNVTLWIVSPKGSKIGLLKLPAEMDDQAITQVYLDGSKTDNCVCQLEQHLSDKSKALLFYSQKPLVSIWVPNGNDHRHIKVDEKVCVNSGQVLVIQKKGRLTDIYVQ